MAPCRPDDPRRSDSLVTPGRVATVTAAALAVAAAVFALVLARQVLLVTFLGIVVGTVLCFPIDWMARRLPRWLALLITLVLFFGVVAAAIAFLVPVVRDQINELERRLGKE